MSAPLAPSPPQAVRELPLVSAVYLVHNRKDELGESVRRLLNESGYPAERLELIVVDNASTDGTVDMVREEFPEATLIETGANLGAPAWNAGFRVARGDYILILDDDAYPRPGALLRAVQAAREEDAGLVSFTVVSSHDEEHRFNDEYATGLLSYWGCAALVSRSALDELGGYDPYIFIWANELELTMRLLDRGFAHVYVPDAVAVHMKQPNLAVGRQARCIRYNCRHWAYAAGKLMRPYDAVVTAASLALWTVVETAAHDRTTIRGFPAVFAGFAAGLRNRQPVRPVVSSTYRKNFHSFAWPWRYWRSPAQRWRAWRGIEDADAQRRHLWAQYFDERRAFYPEGRGSLRL